MKEDIDRFLAQSEEVNYIDNNLYEKYNVKRGLRNEDKTGVLVSLTKIADVVGYKKENNHKIETKGELYYRGYNVRDLLKNTEGKRYLFEETCFLLLFGYLPNKEELELFKKDMASRYQLPVHFLETKILALPSLNVMNKLQQEVLMLYGFDEDNPDDVSVRGTLKKGLNLIARIPFISVYAYRSKAHYYNNESLFIHPVDENLSIAESILYSLRSHKTFTKKEAEVLDLCLVLHADHGGGNNSTFTNVVISSTGTDIYSAFAGSIGSLKGPRHGGANLAAKRMMKEVISEVGLHSSDEALSNVADRILDKDFYDKSGLIYGIGHAVYTLSDPREEILEEKAYELAKEKNRLEEFEVYKRFKQIAIDKMKERKGVTVCANVDFYSGFVYDMLCIPDELFPTLFVSARSVGWLAHNLENKLYCDRIIRPAGKYVGEIKEYKEIEER